MLKAVLLLPHLPKQTFQVRLFLANFASLRIDGVDFRHMSERRDKRRQKNASDMVERIHSFS